MTCKIQPLHDLVIVQREAAEQKTAGGIVLPELSADKPERGEVLAVGQGRLLVDGTLVPLGVKPGDKVIFNRNAGRTIKVDEEEHFFLYENEILAIVE